MGRLSCLRTPTRSRYTLLLQELERMYRDDKATSVALLRVRLSGLDAVNDRFGYTAGDRLIEAFTDRVSGILRRRDRLVTLSGRHLAVLLHNPLHEGHAVLAAGRITQAAAEPLVIDQHHLRLQVHIGVSALPRGTGNPQELLRQCEAALAASCLQGEPHVHYSPALAPAHGSTAGYAWFDVEEALKAGEFELFYQPQVDLASGALAGAEALVRWHKPGVGYVPPGHFMGSIERSHSMRALLWYVLNSALRQTAAWTHRQPDLRIAVNLAAGNLADPDLVDLVENALNVWGVQPGRLTLELTESSLMQNPGEGSRAMARLRELGTRTSIDDFGTGYSSLAYLRDLPANELKVDRAFVSRIDDGRRDHDIVASIVQLAHAVDLQVVAEGIEKAETLARLTTMGCDIGQGYFFARPLPAQGFEDAWLNAGVTANSA